MAISAPIYVYANGFGFCKPSAVPSLVDKFQKQLQEILVQSIKNHAEPWDVLNYKEIYWPKNKILLKNRIDKANGKYNNILILADNQLCISDSV